MVTFLEMKALICSAFIGFCPNHLCLGFYIKDNLSYQEPITCSYWLKEMNRVSPDPNLNKFGLQLKSHTSTKLSVD